MNWTIEDQRIQWSNMIGKQRLTMFIFTFLLTFLDRRVPNFVHQFHFYGFYCYFFFNGIKSLNFVEFFFHKKSRRVAQILFPLYLRVVSLLWLWIATVVGGIISIIQNNALGQHNFPIKINETMSLGKKNRRRLETDSIIISKWKKKLIIKYIFEIM